MRRTSWRGWKDSCYERLRMLTSHARSLDSKRLWRGVKSGIRSGSLLCKTTAWLIRAWL